MGPGVPYAIGAKFAHPDRPAFALVGDGAMQMNGMNELITIAKYWQEWADPRLVVAVLHNNDLNQVTWEMRAMGGAPQFLPSQQLPDFPYAGYRPQPRPGRRRGGEARQVRARGTGAGRRPAVRGRSSDRPGRAADPATRHLGPDGQGASPIVRGDTDRVDVIKEGVKTKVQELLPGGRGE